MCTEISAFNTPSRAKQAIISKSDTLYKLQPWGDTSTHLPLIFKKCSKKQRDSVSQIKQKLRAFASLHNEKQLSTKSMKKDKSLHNLRHHKNERVNRYNSINFKQKTIKIFEPITSGSLVKRFDRKSNRKLIINKGLQELDNHSNRYSTCQEITLKKAQKRIELERKIYMFMSRDRL